MNPLRQPKFIILWLAASTSYIGSLVHLTAASWLMMEMTSSPLFVALIQTATFLPSMLVTLPAGVLADQANRKYVLLVTQGVMFVTVTVLVFLVHWHAIRPLGLLLITLILGIANNMNGPAWQVAIIDIVSREHFPKAATLSNLSYNLARAIGPALGGLMIGLWGLTVPFIFDAISYLAVLIVIFCWSEAAHRPLPSSGEKLWQAIRTGWQFSWWHPALRTLIWQNIGFFFSASAIWSLLALIARHTLHLSALGYGLLLGCMGSGAVICGTALFFFRTVWPTQRIILTGIIAYGIASLGLALVHKPFIAGICCFIGGCAWIALTTSLNIASQLQSPDSLRARIYSIYAFISNAALAVGSVFFGKIADWSNAEVALLVAGFGLLALWWGLRSQPVSLE